MITEPKTLLLVADEPSSRESLAGTLRAAGFAVTTTTEREPLGTAGPPALVLRVRSPARPGTTRPVARDESPSVPKRLPVLELGPADAADSAYERGAVGFVALPVTPEVLIAEVRTALVLGFEPESHDASGSFTRSRSSESVAAADATTADPEAWSRYYSAQVMMRRGQEQEARDGLERLVEGHPEFWRAHGQLARLWQAEGRPRRARAALVRSLELHPDQAEERRLLREWQDALRRAPDDTDAETAAAGPSRVLVADDDPDIRTLLRAVLTDAGFEVELAEDGDEAVECARRRRPDLVLLDGLMPRMQGFETCRAIKKRLFPDDPPKVLLVTSIAAENLTHLEADDAYGVDAVLRKPIDPVALVGEVRRALDASEEPRGEVAATPDVPRLTTA